MGTIMIEAAINGNASKELNPNIPYSPEEIGHDAIATCRAGAALIHLHVREPDGAWVQTLDYYAKAIMLTREQCTPLIWPTFPFGDDPAVRFQHFYDLCKDPKTRLDLGAADMGSVNFVEYNRHKKSLRGGQFVYQNSYNTIRYFLEGCRELKLRPTLQIFEPGFLRAALTYLDMGLLDEPLLLKFYFSDLFGLPPSLRSLDAYLGMLDGVQCNWFGSYIGGDVLPFVPLFVSMGGHVRLGLEDYQYAEEGKLTNAQITATAVAAIRGMGHEVATPDQARQILQT
jgi:3-keto-5-aminohexanoate cleavage enzyme